MTARYIVGDVFDVLRSLPDGSVDLVLTSPPFLALRSYLPADHPDKGKEIGSEPTPGAFIDTLLDVAEECRRVLAPHGSLCFELGDTYAGSGGAGGDYGEGGLREGQPVFRQRSGWHRSGNEAEDRYRKHGGAPESTGPNGGEGWPEPKSLCLIPELFRVSLVYGFNPLTGRTTPRWRARNVIRWCRPNPPVGALGDKFRPATSDMVVACTSRKRYFDLDAVRTEPTVDPATYTGNGYTKGNPAGNGKSTAMAGNPAGAPPLDWWNIPTQGYAGSHYATWPTALLTRPILAMCPQRVCTECGKPSERIVAPTDEYASRPFAGQDFRQDRDGTCRKSTGLNGPRNSDRPTASYETLGWSDCGHDAWRPGVVLDIFAGSGTTLAVATGHGRDAIGIDLDARNAALAYERVGMWLTVEEFAAKDGVA